MGNAYGIARSTLAAPKSVSPTDGFLNRTTGLFSNIDEITESLGNCSSSISYSDAQQTTHVPDLHTCDVIYNPVGSCTIDHNVSVDSYKFTVSVSAQAGLELMPILILKPVRLLIKLTIRCSHCLF